MKPGRPATGDRGPTDPLRTLANQLRSEGSVISPHVSDPRGEPLHGALAAAGPRAAATPEGYALVVETVREGYLLHYAEPRVLSGHDDDLALLAGDYLYALGLERLALLGDSAAVAELSDLISLTAQAHAEGRPDLPPALWLAATVAVGCGADDRHERAKREARDLAPGAAARLVEEAASRAREEGLGAPFGRISESIDFDPARQV